MVDLAARIRELRDLPAKEVAQRLGVGVRSVQAYRRRDRIHGPGSSVGLYTRSSKASQRDETKGYKPLPPLSISLPSVSILGRDLDLTDADYVAGQKAMREAGL